MSIFDFLKEMFFCRTEKSGNQMYLNGRTEISADLENFFTIKFMFFWKNENLWKFRKPKK